MREINEDEEKLHINLSSGRLNKHYKEITSQKSNKLSSHFVLGNELMNSIGFSHAEPSPTYMLPHDP